MDKCPPKKYRAMEKNKMEEIKRDFKGIWISKEVWLDERLNALDKIILAEIDSLDVEGEGCFASNQYLSEFCQCSERKISDSISTLMKLGYVSVISFDGRKRIIQSRIAKFARQSSKICEAALQNLRHNNIDNNIDNKKEKYIKEKTEIIDYLNSKLGTKYRVNSKLTSSHINARLEEGYTVDDFKRVIDSKILKWGNDIKMSQYLTPDTLFGVKFEKYVNETPTEKTTEVIEHYHNDCPYCHGTGVILDRDENGEEVARICKCQKRDGAIL